MDFRLKEVVAMLKAEAKANVSILVLMDFRLKARNVSVWTPLISWFQSLF